MFRHCRNCHRFCWADPLPTPPNYSKDKHHVLPDRYVCRCGEVTWGPDIAQEEAS